MKCYVIEWTAANLEEARRIASELIENKYAACVNILPGVESYFYWEGNLEKENEVLVLIKTTERCVPTVIQVISKLSCYDVPAIISFPIAKGNQTYLDWISKNTQNR